MQILSIITPISLQVDSSANKTYNQSCEFSEWNSNWTETLYENGILFFQFDSILFILYQNEKELKMYIEIKYIVIILWELCESDIKTTL